MSRDSDAREPLTRDRVLAAAVGLVDREGMPALTMRRLGQDLGVEAMSLYHHVANKDALLASMLDRVMAEAALPDLEGDWKAEIRGSAISVYQALERHPWAAPLMMGRVDPSLSRLRWMNAVLGALRTHGFPVELTHHAYHAIDSHIIGFALWIASLPERGPDDLPAVAEALRPALPEAEFPHLLEHIQYHLDDDGTGEREFDFGLDLILDGIERLRDRP